jgi:hypothetical protein
MNVDYNNLHYVVLYTTHFYFLDSRTLLHILHLWAKILWHLLKSSLWKRVGNTQFLKSNTTIYIQYISWGNLRERDHWGDPDVDGKIILRWIFRKWDGVVRTGWIWLRIGRGGAALVSTVRNLQVPKMRGISWLAAVPVSFSRRTLLHGVSNLVHTVHTACLSQASCVHCVE